MYWLFSDSEGQTPDIAFSDTELIWATPERNKAVLTPADGSTIMLDAAAKGNISDQQGVKIIKIDSSLLSYDNTFK